MKKEQYERETGKQAMVFSPKGMSPSNGYVQWLEEKVEEMMGKAEAYDRLMIGEYTLKDMANIFQMYSAIDKDGYARLFADPPFIDGNGWSSKFPEDEWSIPGIVDFNGDWTTSLTLPDGLEEK